MSTHKQQMKGMVLLDLARSMELIPMIEPRLRPYQHVAARHIKAAMHHIQQEEGLDMLLAGDYSWEQAKGGDSDAIFHVLSKGATVLGCIQPHAVAGHTWQPEPGLSFTAQTLRVVLRKLTSLKRTEASEEK